MSFKTNKHVERLKGFRPSDGGGQLLAEFASTPASDELDTAALRFVSDRIDDTGTNLIVLTGDAGHGKTHLCRTLLRNCGVQDPREALKLFGDGSSPAGTTKSGRPIRIIKDLSELSSTDAQMKLAQAINDDRDIWVVCANEGRLRNDINSSEGELDGLGRGLSNVLTLGRTNNEESIQVVNLNHQSISSKGKDSLASKALLNWVSDDRKWSICDSCDAKPDCPIFLNRTMLGGGELEHETRRNGVVELLAVIEQTDTVVTIRHLMIFLAHVITGGLDCGEVEEHIVQGEKNWQSVHLFHENAFASGINADEIARLPMFSAAVKMDPGNRGVRRVDDGLSFEVDEMQERFLPKQVWRTTPRNRKERTLEAKQHSDMVRFFRRKTYFDAGAEGSPASFAERLGFSSYDDFVKIADQSDGEQVDFVRVRDSLLAGLEAVQGARKQGGGQFSVIDPAFSSSASAAAVVAAKLSRKNIHLIHQTKWWQIQSEDGGEPNLPTAVDWRNRSVIIHFSESTESQPVGIALDLRQFEFVTRAGAGLVSRTFFHPEIRRIMSELSPLAEGFSGVSDTISVLVGGREHKIMIDTGQVIKDAG